MKVIILAAGKGSRLGRLGEETAKPLLPILNEPLLLRTIRQLYQHGLTKITVVTGHNAQVLRDTLSDFSCLQFIHNKHYQSDKNILSLLLALRNQSQSVLVIEGDVVFSDAAIAALATMVQADSSVWAACGEFRPGQVGGIMRVDEEKNMFDLRYVSEYSEQWQGYLKNLGAIFIHESIVPKYCELLEKAASESTDQYFMDPWVLHAAELPAKVMDMGIKGAISFNTVKEYEAACDLMRAATVNTEAKSYPVELVRVNELRHIEDYSRSRVVWLKDKIKEEGLWTRPICLDDSHGLVMDGQHRMEVALSLGLRYIPAIRFCYKEVEVWSLRPDTHEVTVEEIIDRALNDNIYPYKTAKHKFPDIDFSCAIPLEKLL